MAQDGYIDATWVGPAGLALANGTLLVPGETVVSIPEGEAKASDHWQPVAEEAPTVAHGARHKKKDGDES